MRRDTVVSAPKRARMDDPSVATHTVAHSEAPVHAPVERHGRAYYAALGKLALENMRHTVDWCVDTLRLPYSRRRDDAGHNSHEQ